MKKILRLVLSQTLVLAFLIVLAQVAFAGTAEEPKDPSFGLNSAARLAGLLEAEPEVIIGRIIQGLLGFVGLIAFILTIYAGGLWMTAGGNEEKVKKAKEILRNAVIGMAIIFTSYAITEFIIANIASETLR